MRLKRTIPGTALLALIVFGTSVISRLAGAAEADHPVEISGRFPHLAMLNRDGECGTGAVVPWADRLWVITYSPHEPKGSDDKLYEIDANLNRTVRPESVGGTPADRMIHRESNQLIIGPYFIDAKGNVRVVPPAKMHGRLTAAARDLSDPANKVYIYDMEGALFEVDVHTLEAKKLFTRAAPGAHGKGAYTGQGDLILANNGNAIVNKAKPAADDPGYDKDPEADGSLTQWDGKTWRAIERRQFTDVTGPGGLDGSADDKSPVWAIGWDRRSVLLNVLDAGVWHTFRMPIADYSYAAKHGWYTEWPRIREVAPGKLLMNMHGQWFDFPKTFSATQTAGIRPIGDYQKITGDFCGWNGRIVFGCDDASIMENPLLGQSQSNLWFTSWEGLAQCGRPAGFGGPWVHDDVKAGEASEPYLFAGYSQRVVHIAHQSEKPVTFTFEIDREGNGKWSDETSVTVQAHGYASYVFPAELSAEWIRVKTDSDCAGASVYFQYGPGGGAVTDRKLFASVADAGDSAEWSAGTLRPLGSDRGSLLFSSTVIPSAGQPTETRQLELGPDMQFRPYTGPMPADPKGKNAGADFEVSADASSVIVTEKTSRYRVPISNPAADITPSGIAVRHFREIVTERFLVNASGSMFVLPRVTAGGASRIKPLCSHDKRFTDFCSWRGMLVLAGNRADAKPDGHYFAAPGQNAGLWLGDIDDVWKLGKPRGHGGPWLNSEVVAGAPSDPYLMAGYDQKSIDLSDDSAKTVHIRLEVDFLADGTWSLYREFDVQPGKTVHYDFPSAYGAHWLRATCDTACHATAQLLYK